ncbi:hypothetical protein DMENIID0001_042320 [Sergentomyia squamirostris]
MHDNALKKSRPTARQFRRKSPVRPESPQEDIEKDVVYFTTDEDIMPEDSAIAKPFDKVIIENMETVPSVDVPSFTIDEDMVPGDSAVENPIAVDEVIIENMETVPPVDVPSSFTTNKDMAVEKPIAVFKEVRDTIIEIPKTVPPVNVPSTTDEMIINLDMILHDMQLCPQEEVGPRIEIMFLQQRQHHGVFAHGMGELFYEHYDMQLPSNWEELIMARGTFDRLIIVAVNRTLGYWENKEKQEVLSHMKWPPQSPDLNPIELLWDELDREVMENKPTSKTHLWELLQKSWEEISQETLSKLTERMPRLCRAVIKAKGGFF